MTIETVHLCENLMQSLMQCVSVAVKREHWDRSGKDAGLLLTRTVFDTIPKTRYLQAVP